MTLGNDLAAGERPQAIVPAGHWQAAETLGDWTLVGCTVAPGFQSSPASSSRRRTGSPAVNAFLTIMSFAASKAAAR